MATTELIRYITDQSTSMSIGNTDCYTKPGMWLVYDTDGPSGDFGNIMCVKPPNINMTYEQVFLKYNEQFDYATGGEVELDNIQLQDGDKVWLSNQSVVSESGIYIVRDGPWDFYKVVDEDLFVDLGARAYDQVDGDISRSIITDQYITFNEVGFYTIKYYVLNSQGILSTKQRKVKIIRDGASIVPTDNVNITDYKISTEFDSSLLFPDDPNLDSCDACEPGSGGNIGGQIPDDDDDYLPPVNNNIYIRKDGSITFTENQSMGGNRLTEVADPINDTDAVNLRTVQKLVNENLTIGDVYTTGEDIAINQVVYMETDGLIYKANSSNMDHMSRVLGIATQMQPINTEVPVVSIGSLDGFTGLNQGKYYFVSSAGTITDVVPITGFTQIIAMATSSTEIFINLQTPIGI